MNARILLVGALLAWARALEGTGACQTVQGDVLTAHDSGGSIFMAYNVSNGEANAVRMIRMTSAGAILWSRELKSGFQDGVFSAVMDSRRNLLLAGERREPGGRRFLLLKIRPDGEKAWEATDSRHDCTALRMVVDDFDAVAVAGICRADGLHPARLIKFTADGSLLWAQEYDGGGRNYVRSLNGFRGDLALTVETVADGSGRPSDTIKVLVYSPSGQRVTP